MFKLFKKDLKIFFSDKRSVVLTFLLPIILISLFAYAYGGMGGNSNKPEPTNILVVDLDKTEHTKIMIANLDSLSGLKVFEGELSKSRELVIKGEYSSALIFHKGFKDSIEASKKMPLELVYDKGQEMEIGMLQPVILSTIKSSAKRQQIKRSIETAPNNSIPNQDERTSENSLIDTSSFNENDINSDLIMTSIVGEKVEVNFGLIQAVSGVSILMLLFSVAGIGSSILEEKENGTLKRLLYSPLKNTVILYGKMLTTFFIAIIQLSVMFLFSWLAYGLDITMNLPALILMIIATAFAVTSFGIFLAAVSKTRQQAQSLSTLIILIMSAVGGSMIPLAIMPAIMKKIAVFSLNYWGIQGFYDIFWRSLSLIEILPRVFVLIGMGLFMTFISIRLYKRNILKIV